LSAGVFASLSSTVAQVRIWLFGHHVCFWWIFGKCSLNFDQVVGSLRLLVLVYLVCALNFFDLFLFLCAHFISWFVIFSGCARSLLSLSGCLWCRFWLAGFHGNGRPSFLNQF
jgi:hypothetical protein